MNTEQVKRPVNVEGHAKKEKESTMSSAKAKTLKQCLPIKQSTAVLSMATRSSRM